MRSSREQPTSNKEDSQQRVAVKPQRYAGVPSSVPAQTNYSSHAGQRNLLEQMLAKDNMTSAFKRVKQNGEHPVLTM